MTKIWQGPETTQGRKLWYGLERGASLSGLAGTTTSNGVTTGNPFPIAVTWLGTWLQKNPSWNWQTLAIRLCRPAPAANCADCWWVPCADGVVHTPPSGEPPAIPEPQ